ISRLAEFMAGERVGKIVGILAATNPLLIYYSQEGRTYALTTLFVTASFYYLLKYLKHTSRRDVFFYVICLLGTLWTSYLAWFVVLPQVIYVLLKKRYDLLAWQV